MKRNFVNTLILASILSSGYTYGQEIKKTLPAEQEISLQYGADRLGKRKDAAMKKFRENRLGAFIHWGLYAIPGG